MLRRAVELGITYFDTAVGYCGGDSQRVLGEALEGMRERVVLSTKNHHYNKADKDGWWKNLNDSLERLRTDHLDIYNFHGLNWETYEASLAGEDGLYREVLRAKEQGMVRHICHSFHGSVESLKRCVSSGLFEVVTLQYNLLDRSLEEGILAAREAGMGVVIMGPVGGGRLGFPSDKAGELVRDVKSTPELALRFVLSNPNVNVALSGMSTMQQLEENVRTVSSLGELSSEDHKRIEEAIEERKKLSGLYCTGCNYCMPCADGVDIPANFEILNLERVFGLSEHARARYAALGGKAALCRLCGKCVPLCPQDLDIPARLADAVTLLDERSGTVGGWMEMRGARQSTDRTEVELDLRYHLKNYSDRDMDRVTVQLHSHREENIDPSRFELKGLKKFARRHRDLKVRMPRHLDSYSIDGLLESNGSRAVEHFGAIVAAATEVSGAPDPSERPAATIHVPGPYHPAHVSEKKIKGHSFDFAARHDANALYVWAEVEDDLAHLLSGQPTRGVRGDLMRVFVDARASEALGMGGYTERVMHVSVYPSDSAPGGAVAKASRDPADADAQPEARATRTPSGYRLSCTIPWKALGVEKAPAVIGFDCVQISHDAEGAENVRLSWTGRAHQERFTAGFGRLLLVQEADRAAAPP